MRAFLVVAIAALLTSRASGARPPVPGPQSGSEPPDVSQWFSTVEEHTPGRDDAAVRAIMAIPPETFSRVLGALRRRADRVEVFNRLVHRAALLHMDAAILVQSGVAVDLPRPPAAARGRSTVILTHDGGYTGMAGIGVHWELGRTLLDLTQPRADEDPWVLRWYVASSSFMLNRSLLADLSPHLEKARKLFSSDADILYASGCYFESMASPRVRPVIDSKSLPPGLRIDAPSTRESWRIAEGYFRRAVEARLGFGWARIRRARMLDRLGRHDEAIRELHNVTSTAEEPAMLYLAALFEGAAQEAVGNASAARERYEAAARRFPNSQAAYLALSRLARDRGDRAAARAAAERVFRRQTTGEMDDPWWTYDFLFVRTADEQLSDVRKPFEKRTATDSAKVRN